MISRFQYITQDVHLNVNLNSEGFIFEGNDNKEIAKYYSANSSGLKWIYQKEDVVILENNQHIKGYPSPDLLKIIAIYPIDSPRFPSPNNAVIYNQDGSIYLQLNVPELISETARERIPYMNYENSVRLYFDNVGWFKDSNSNFLCSITIGFDREWWESRVLNPETGEFGECLGSGRR